MATGNFVAYYRVSTKRQGQSGLGLEAQKAAVETYLNGGRWKMVADFTEVESGRNNQRPQLAAAFQACRVYKATLVIAKLDRLSRNAHFLLGLKESGVDFVCADMPEANRLTIGILALVAEQEGKAISERTKAALAAAKARGVKLGGLGITASGKQQGRPLTSKARLQGNAARTAQAAARAQDLKPVIAELQASGIGTLLGIAKALNERGITAAQGGAWTATQVGRLLAATSN
jgi:DNA invertase Pin-like site-specific DNA recombinase